MNVEFPLHFMQKGERGRVVGVRWGEEDVARRLVQMGFEKGVPFEVVRYDAEQGVTVRIGDREIPIVPWVASLIYATEEPPE
ncbi:MAG TPA: FeoA family protein [Gemmatimonadota bacterium]|nr:FeoA family protein [Gemmatimonadota bacterium]